MTSVKKERKTNFNIEIGDNDSNEWSDEKLAKLKAFVKSESSKRTPERVLRNEILSIQYQMEEYIENGHIDKNDVLTLERFLNIYLKTLNLTLKRFAQSIDTTDGNLKKYISGERKFNIDLAMKFAHFFHTAPDIWLKIQIKNELIELENQKEKISKYKKYDYEKVI